jgi:hypothetical protein
MCITMERKRLESDTIVPFLVHLFRVHLLTAIRRVLASLQVLTHHSISFLPACQLANWTLRLLALTSEDEYKSHLAILPTSGENGINFHTYKLSGLIHPSNDKCTFLYLAT